MRKFFGALIIFLVMAALYFLFRPVPVEAVPYGNVLKNLQYPAGYPINTAAIETEDFLYIGSLAAPNTGRLSKKDRALI